MFMGIDCIFIVKFFATLKYFCYLHILHLIEDQVLVSGARPYSLAQFLFKVQPIIMITGNSYRVSIEFILIS